MTCVEEARNAYAKATLHMLPVPSVHILYTASCCCLGTTTTIHADDAAPKESKTLWLATFYLCIPTGYAIGYLAGGFVAAPLGWRAPFLLEAAIMAPFVVLCMCLPPIKLKAQTPGDTAHLCSDQVPVSCLHWLCVSRVLAVDIGTVL